MLSPGINITCAAKWRQWLQEMSWIKKCQIASTKELLKWYNSPCSACRVLPEIKSSSVDVNPEPARRVSLSVQPPPDGRSDRECVCVRVASVREDDVMGERICVCVCVCQCREVCVCVMSVCEWASVWRQDLLWSLHNIQFPPSPTICCTCVGRAAQTAGIADAGTTFPARKWKKISTNASENENKNYAQTFLFISSFVTTKKKLVEIRHGMMAMVWVSFHFSGLVFPDRTQNFSFDYFNLMFYSNRAPDVPHNGGTMRSGISVRSNPPVSCKRRIQWFSLFFCFFCESPF